MPIDPNTIRWDAPAAPPPAASAPRGFQPGQVLTPPRPDPYKAAAEERAQQDQALQQSAAARSAASERRSALEWSATHNPDGTPKPNAANDGKPTEYQAKSAQFLGRLIEANNQFGEVPAGSRDARTPPGQWLHEVVPSVENMFNTPDRQIADQAARNFVAASLRQESGAAISASEFDNQYRIFFPMPGDGPDVIKKKAEARRQAIEGFKVAAGPLAEAAAATAVTPPDVSAGPDETKKTAGAIVLPGGKVSDGGSPDGPGPLMIDGQPVFDQAGNPVTTDFQGEGFDKSGQSLGLFGRVTDDAPAQQPQVSPFMASVGDIAQGAGDIVGLVGNPLNAAINAATGTSLSTDLGETLRTDILGIPHGDNPVMEMANRGGVAALTGSMGARAAAELANPGVWRNALEIIGRTPIRDTAAGMSAGIGGYAGRQSGIPGGELIGSLAGGLTGYGTASAVNAATNAERSGGNALLQAAQRQGVDLLPAETGGPVAKAVTTGTKASPFSVAPVVTAAQRSQGQMANAAARAARSQGENVTTDLAGQNVRNAAERFTRETSRRASRLYDRANEAAQGVAITPAQTIAKLDEYIARVQNDPSAPASAVAELQSFRDKIAGGVNVAGLRDARTRLSQGVYDGKLRSSSDTAMWKDILNNLSGDIETGLSQAGKSEAAQMFKRADAFWKDRVEHIDQVLQPVLGRDRGGEQIVQAVESMARGQSGGNARLSRLLANMSPEEAGQVRSVIVDRIGRATPGAQTAEGDAFSAATFLTNWNKMTSQAKASLFSDKDLRQNLNDIARLAEGMKASQAMANHSNTAIGLGANLGIQGSFAAVHPIAAILGAGGQYVTGRLMASPRFARVLAKSVKLPPEMAGRKIAQELGVLAAQEPLVANDARQLQQYLNQAFAQSPTRAAAQGQQEGDGR